MLREILSVFRTDDEVSRMKSTFLEALKLSHELTEVAGVHFFERPPSHEDVVAVHERDVELNKLQRRLRKQVIAHVTLSSSRRDAQHALMWMSLIKDVERIGDYSKNLVEVYELGGSPLPDDEVAAELRGIREVAEEVSRAAGAVMERSDSARAQELIRRGRESKRRCDPLVRRIAQGPYDAGTTTTLVLGTRFYKRIQSHLQNVLTSVVMPLHKLDYYDERSLPGQQDED